MGKRHKWADVIVAWSEGAEIEWRWITSIEGTADNWHIYQKDNELTFFEEGVEFRIKPQPKEPQYLYVWLEKDTDAIVYDYDPPGSVKEDEVHKYIGKIKLEVDDD